jgi:UDP-glucuronate 4-epimerase
MNKKHILVTGAAGFIGYHTINNLIEQGFSVVGIDNINDYYDVNLKYARLAEAGIYAKDETKYTGGIQRNYSRIEFDTPIKSIINPSYTFVRLNLEDKAAILRLFEDHKFNYVVNLAAQAGVRYSIDNPDVYIQSNIVGFMNILEGCRYNPVEHLVYASSSSVYGNSDQFPYATSEVVNDPESLYAATKATNELLANTYHNLYGIPVTGLRYFTVYGPWGRPDMALMLFTKAIIDGKPIDVFNGGDLKRDFTFIDDIVEGTVKVLLNLDKGTNGKKLFNIGNGSPVQLLDFITTIEKYLGKEAEKNMLPMQAGDVKITFADTKDLAETVNYKPKVDLIEGVEKFMDWYKNFYKNI